MKIIIYQCLYCCNLSILQFDKYDSLKIQTAATTLLLPFGALSDKKKKQKFSSKPCRVEGVRGPQGETAGEAQPSPVRQTFHQAGGEGTSALRKKKDWQRPRTQQRETGVAAPPTSLNKNTARALSGPDDLRACRVNWA